MKYCVRCVYPENHPLGLLFDEEGVCSGCRVHEEKDVLNWNERGEKLRKIFDEFRSRDGRNYDCIIPVSGARDSYFIVDVVKNVYKMHPLLVNYNKHYNTQIGIRNLAYLRSLIGADIHTLTVAPQTVKKITRATLDKNASMYWHCLAGQTVLPVSTAVRFKIPLIVWGVHQGCDQVGMFSHLDEVEMTRKYRKDHDLMGYEAEDLEVEYPNLSSSDLAPFRYPHDKEIESVGVRGIYLSNYIRWDSKAQHENMIRKYGYETALQQRTFDNYNDVDCFHYSDLHDYIKFAKWGYGKVSDHASREIRLHRMTRKEAIQLIQHYQNVKPDPYRLRLFLDWIGISEGELFANIDRYRDSNIWVRNSKGEYELTDSLVNHQCKFENNLTKWPLKESCNFYLSQSKAPGVKDDHYVLIGKGWID